MLDLKKSPSKDTSLKESSSNDTSRTLTSTTEITSDTESSVSDTESSSSRTAIGSSNSDRSTYDSQSESNDPDSDVSDSVFDIPTRKTKTVSAESILSKNISSKSDFSRTSFNSNTESDKTTPKPSNSTVYEKCSSSEDEEEVEDLAAFQRAQFTAVCGDCSGEMHSQEPWPQDVKLFQPYEVEQIILPDNANCLAVQAYLKMCGLNFEVEPRHNAEYMSPSGRVPFIKCGAFVVSELDPIIGFISSKGISLSDKMDPAQKADMRAYMSLVNTVLANAELYVTWCDPTTLAEVTKPRYGSVYPWPLNHIINWQKRNQVKKRLAVLGWYQKSLKEVYAEVENCCNALSERLEKKDYFFGTKPTELDALVFGHLFTILTTPLPNNQFASIIRGYPHLIELCKRIERDYFERSDQ